MVVNVCRYRGNWIMIMIIAACVYWDHKRNIPVLGLKQT